MDMEYFWQIVLTSSLVSAIVGGAINYLFTLRINREERLFNARQNVYAKLLAQLRRIEANEEKLQHKSKLTVESLLNESILLAGDELNGLLEVTYDDFAWLKPNALSEYEVPDDPTRITRIKAAMKKELGIKYQEKMRCEIL